MSIRVFGVLELADTGLQLDKQIGLSFLIVEQAAKNKIGIKIGGNVDPNYTKKFDNMMRKLPFELMDDPIDINAECLFIGNGIELDISGERIDFGESLPDRMLRVQNFLVELVKNSQVDQIILDINIEEGDEFERIEIPVMDFRARMLSLYERESNWTPTVRLIIKK